MQRPENALATHLVINLSNVNFLAAAGVNVIIDVATHRHINNTHLVVTVNNATVARVIDLTGTAEFLTMHTDLDRCLEFINLA